METKVISDKIQEFNGERFYLCGQYFQHRGKRLHRVVWQYHYGDIPKGYHIHHHDGNRHNNSIENLKLVEAKEHLSHHMSNEEAKKRAGANIKAATIEAAKWHRSAKGKEWHSKLAKEVWEKREPVMYRCNYCGALYHSVNISHQGNHFCSGNCKAAFRRASGVDNETRVCELCGKEYITNKYSRQRYCSLMCSRHSRKWRRDTDAS